MKSNSPTHSLTIYNPNLLLIPLFTILTIITFINNRPVPNFQPTDQQKLQISKLQKEQKFRSMVIPNYHLAFKHPPNYSRIEKSTVEPDTLLHSITLLSDNPQYSTNIQINIYSNSDNLSIQDWLVNNNPLPNLQKLFDITISNNPAEVYQSSKDHPYLNVITTYKNFTYIISVGYITDKDLIIEDYNSLIKSLKFIN